MGFKKYAGGIVGIALAVSGFAAGAPARAAGDANVTQAAVGAVASDTQVSQVKLATTSVGVTYPVDARLFGIIPLTLATQVSISNTGEVSIRYPWYGFLCAVDQAEVETKLVAVGQAVRSFNTAVLTTQQQLSLLALMHAALQSSLSASTTASSSVQ
jgi:hypothetical protein